jgi:hypothetical protein
MDQIDSALKIIQILIKEPMLFMFLVSMGVVGFSLYIVLQAISKKG